MDKIGILRKEDEILAALKKYGEGIPSNFVAFYHGGLNSIITDTRLMCIHFFDRQVHRGYAVFDTCNMFNRKLYLFDQHMDRFDSSMRLAKLKRAKTAQDIKNILFKIAAITGEKTLNFRYWCSRGAKDLDITTKPEEPTIFYCVAMKGRPVVVAKEMMNAFTVNIEVKGPLLAKAKTTNYLLNCLAADEAAKKGGLAIMKTEDGYVTEGSVQAVAFVLKDKTFYAPPYERALQSITQDRVLELVETFLVGKGMISKISRERMTIEDLKDKVEEMMLLGGERIIPITRWDGQIISLKKGPVTEKIMKLLQDDYSNPEMTINVPNTKL
jgi:branched-subunit amino acid aminotransferase/4-amino-4-deoxychorismate lyase